MSSGNWKSKVFVLLTRLSLTGVVLAGAAAVALTAAAPPAYASQLTPPEVPANLQVPAGNKLFLVGHATGTQNYICLPTATGFAFTLFTPQATLFNDQGGEIIHHYFGPNPAEANTNPKVLGEHMIRPAWQDSKDSSTVWAYVQPGNSSTDPAFVEPGAVAWLLLTAAGSQDGPTGGNRLSGTTYIQRLNTHGGVAPSTGCATAEDVGNQAHVPYTTDYYFYKSAGR
jgi:hypothetical protein